MSPRSTRIIAATLATSGLVLALVFGEAASALAQDGVTFVSAPQSVVYGQNWHIDGQITPESGSDGDYGNLTVTTAGASAAVLNPDEYGLDDGAFELGDFDWNDTLGAGTHNFSVKFSGGVYTAASTTTAVVTITPAPIVVTTTIIADPNNSQNAIVTSALTGKFVTQVPSCACEDDDLYPLPAGTWNLTVKDSSGKTAFTKTAAQVARGKPNYVTYWQNVPLGGNYTATSTFTPAANAKANFSLSSKDFPWTSTGTASVGGVAPPSSTPAPKTVSAVAPFAPPTLLFASGLLIALILAALDIVLLVRRRRHSQPPLQPGQGMYS